MNAPQPRCTSPIPSGRSSPRSRWTGTARVRRPRQRDERGSSPSQSRSTRSFFGGVGGGRRTGWLHVGRHHRTFAAIMAVLDVSDWTGTLILGEKPGKCPENDRHATRQCVNIGAVLGKPVGGRLRAGKVAKSPGASWIPRFHFLCANRVFCGAIRGERMQLGNCAQQTSATNPGASRLPPRPVAPIRVNGWVSYFSSAPPGAGGSNLC